MIATASSREMPRVHRYGDTTSSPKSSCDPPGPMAPPASTSKVRPCGVTTRAESPSPTSMEVISSTPGRVSGDPQPRVQGFVLPTKRTPATQQPRRSSRQMASQLAGRLRVRLRGHAPYQRSREAQTWSLALELWPATARCSRRRAWLMRRASVAASEERP